MQLVTDDGLTEGQIVFFPAYGDYFVWNSRHAKAAVAGSIINSPGGQWSKLGLSALAVPIEAVHFTGAPTYTSKTWAAGAYAKIFLDVDMVTPPGSGAVNITLVGRAGTYTINGVFGLGGAPSGLTSATWAIPNAAVDTVQANMKIGIVTGRPLGLTGQASDTTSGHFFVFSGLNTTTAGDVTGLVITAAANFTADIIVSGVPAF